MAILTAPTRLTALAGLAAGLCLAAAGAAEAEGPAAPPALEYAVKANYLFKFTPFVTWPPRVFSVPASPFNLCVVGQDPFGQALDDAVRGQSAGGHPIVVHRYAAAGLDCHLLFVGRLPGLGAAQALKLVQGQPVLTVSDQPGAIIQFVLQDGRVRFDIDAAAAQAAGLVVSSKLLALSLPHRKAAS